MNSTKSIKSILNRTQQKPNFFQCTTNIWNMTGCFDNPERKVAEFKCISCRNWIAIIKIKGLAVVNTRTGFKGQLGRPDNVVLVAMGFENVGDGCALADCGVKLYIAVPAWIDDGRPAAVPNNVRQRNITGYQRPA